jgi:AraC family transcriptional regulator, transcriptional activator of pobA
MLFQGNQEEFLAISETDDKAVIENISQRFNGLIALWCRSGNLEIQVDDVYYNLSPNELIFLTDYSQYKIISLGETRLLKFNKSFYCVVDHDSEVGCKGLLFLGKIKMPILTLDESQEHKLNGLWSVFIMEIASKDNLQEEMLQMLLKRFLILCTRIYKQQNLPEATTSATDIVRQYYYLVDQQFKTAHAVSYYAEVLNKSPKTLSNLFAIAKIPTPLEIIHERLHLEAIKQLKYTNRSIKEIAFDLGFEDFTSFSRFFKNKSGIAASVYRENSIFQHSGSIAN